MNANCSAQSFAVNLEDTFALVLKDFIKCRDGQFLLFGYYNSAGYKNSAIVKMDTLGNIIWQKKLNDASILCAVQNSTGGFYFACHGGLFKTDSLGNLIWSKDYNWNFNYQSPKLLTLLAGDELIMGSYTFVTNITKEAMLTRIDSSGNVIWARRYGSGSVLDVNIGFGKLSPDSFIYFTNVYGNLAALTKVDLDGNVRWCKTKHNLIIDIDFISNNEIILTSMDQPWGDPSRVVISKCDSTGIFTNHICFASPDSFLSADNLIIVDDHTYLFEGKTWITNTGELRSFRLLINDSAQVLSGTIFPDASLIFHYTHHDNNIQDYFIMRKDLAPPMHTNIFCHDDRTTPLCISIPFTFNSIPITESFTQNQILFYGSENAISYNAGTINAGNLVATNYCNSSAIEGFPENNEVTVFPNPFSNSISFKMDHDEIYFLTIYDSKGSCQKKEKFSGTHTLSTDEFIAGIYFYTILCEKEVVKRGKIVKLHTN